MKYIKSSTIIILILLIETGISAQQTNTKQGNMTQIVVKLGTRTDTLQYALGAFMGQWLINNGLTVTNQTLFKRGMDDVLLNRPRLVTDSTIVPIIAAAQLSTQNERNRQVEAQLFATLRGKQGVGILPDGVNYMVVKTGDGIRPGIRDTVVFNAVGVLPDGTPFEDTYKKKQPIITVVANLIPGLNESIQLMPEGSVWRIFIPSALAYGSAGVQGLIPPYSALVFDITLMEVRQTRK